MSPENMSAIWIVIESGSPTASAVANSELWISPDFRNTCRASSARSSIALKRTPSRSNPSTVVASPDRNRSARSWPRSLVCACTVMPGRRLRNGFDPPFSLSKP